MSLRNSSVAAVVRPRDQISRQTRLVAATLTLPILAAMLWFSIPRGTWPRVIIAFLFIAAIYLTAAWLLRGVSIRIGRDGLVERGFFRHDNRIPAKRIAAAHIIDVYRGVSTETHRQLFLLDSSGELLLRMRGEFWSNDDIEAIAGAFDVPVRRFADPITASRLRAQSPDLVYWFERWPWVGGLCMVGAISLLALVLIALMSPSSLVLG
ncbi:hypothetical protein N1027_01590 [Herbiconiux sp. CPCC 205763]|uniref:PH domain-containing protein n=1 Tax=Herbiconiux aconitum TaxID=2970913 RepID=A0ABT2GPX3_9MICO|nr:hypothetical protein [Herbiconiux aconitum]MCS5716821.1 hypothetical protein [Herbiconiux aconitum]